ncbi:glycoside hydrolase family 2 protein [Flavisolibacter ginsenosidimutans]|uniref:Glycoside hydrolase family 2 protein n=1 Tax=Flavisolibacter ginsenosidimutans TaxID=661481 RepID=A0A5B8UFA0_9BACT|nr:glycoside hydrolase family 2 TIM barrel-domain containing protein [Flavisolibacter ginsenosidimutans]QEC55244.1 glycoside hydrolase family 2 protein [Flavisolibacter ginsenosidimutans]
MHNNCRTTLLTFLLLFYFSVFAQNERTITSFDNDWKFYKGDASGAEAVSFNDASWRSLNVPHDWSIEGPYDRANPTSRGGGYLPAGVGWYRKIFSLPGIDASKNFFVEFDGIMAASDVWINGHHLGKRPSGYISLHYELSPYLKFGAEKNVLAVRADNTIQPASRWYTGAGIYRHVRLVSVNPVHVDEAGSFVSSSNVSAQSAKVQSQTTVTNNGSSSQSFVLRTRFLAPDGKEARMVQSNAKLDAGKSQTFTQIAPVKNPALWDIDKPQLYKAITTIIVNKQPVDEYTTSFGIRDAHFEAATGFWLNGKNIKIEGVCLHHDGGAFGAAVPLRVWTKRLQSLKDIGVNGIRTSHNEPSPEFLDLCDKLGFLVMDETFDTWNAAKPNAEKGYNLYFSDWWERDTRDIVTRDCNHPSIVIYSIGNEIHDNLNDSSGFHKYKMQQDLIHSLDSTRPVTMALFRPGLSKVYENGFAAMMDVVGQNYRENELIAAHEKHPDWKVIGTENTHVISMWLALRDKPYMSGQFLWTGYDYLGEADWPRIANGAGLFDKTGEEKLAGYQRQSWWDDKPMVYVTRKETNANGVTWNPDWTPDDPDIYTTADLQVFSNCDEVELFVNGKSVGAKGRTPDNASSRTWTIPFEKGTLKAVGRNGGKDVAQQELKTAGKASKIVLKADKTSLQNSWDDVVYVTASVTDDEGNLVSGADTKINFSISGPGVIAAVDNGDNASSEPYQATSRWSYKGKCVAIIKASGNNGKITLTANAENLKGASIAVDATSEKK